MAEVEHNKETVRRWVEEVWGTGNAELMDELLDANIVDHNPIPGVPPGREGNKSMLRMFHAAFDVAIKLDLLLADGDCVVDRWTASMTHKGEFMGIPATGRRSTRRRTTFIGWSAAKFANSGRNGATRI